MESKDESIIGKALIALFPTKRYAPHKSADSGCPTPPADWDNNDNTEDGAR